MLWLAQQQLKSQSVRMRRLAIQKLRRAGGESVLPSLVRVVQSDPEAMVRQEAAEALGDFQGARATEALVAALTDADGQVRITAVEGLRRLGDAGAVPALVPLLQSADAPLRSRVAQALKLLGWQPKEEGMQAQFLVALGELDRAAILGRAAVEPLAEVLKDRAYQRRVVAVNRLAEIGDPSVVTVIMSALRDEDGLVRTAAANALGRLGDKRAAGNLAAMLKDRDSNVRAASALALGLVGDGAVVETLMRAAKDAHWEVRASVLESLGRLRDGRAVEVLAAALSDPDREVREKAAEGLGLLGDPEGVVPLVGAGLDPESTVRQTAMRSVLRLDPYWERQVAVRDLLPRIREALKSADYGVQQAAQEIMRRMGEEMAVPPREGSRGRRTALEILAELLEDREPVVRQAAVEALGRLDRRSAWLVAPLRQDQDPWVRGAAEAVAAAEDVP